MSFDSRPSRATFPWDSEYQWLKHDLTRSAGTACDLNRTETFSDYSIGARNEIQGLRVAREKTVEQVEQPDA